MIEAAIDCSGRCACCIDGELGCGTSPSIQGDTICLKGCVDTIYGHKCKNACGGNCLKCSQDTGAECFACKPGFYGTSSFCAESCPIRCIDGTCDNDGRCTCIPNFKGNMCDTCVQGRYGDNCENTCSIGCISETCNRNGSCSCLHNFSGKTCDACASEYEGSACDSCIPGLYGDRCQNNCESPNCRCIHSQTCVSCVSGFYGTACNTPCSPGCFDNKCSDDGNCTCKHNFVGTKCDVCAANYKGFSCNICVQGKYGNFCQDACTYINCRCHEQFGCESCKAGFYEKSTFCKKSCGKGCVSLTCEDDGSCSCSPNFMEPNCENCIRGFFGNTCKRTCFYPNCMCSVEYNCDDCKEGYFNISSNCDHLCLDGCIDVCQNDGFCNCKHSFKGTKCDFCDDGFYGQDCSKACILFDNNCLKCKRNDEYCIKCKNGFFSSNGKCIACGINCLEGSCDPFNGRCDLGCRRGFWSDKCDARCNLNCSTCDQVWSVCLHCTTDVVYGPFCNTSCNSSCVQSRCHQKTGTCTHGCIYNRHGTYCEKECSDNCEQNDGESPCNGSGVCTNGCVSGYIGTSCNIERRINTASSTNIATAALVGVFATLFMCTAAGCYLWNRRRSKPIEQSSEIQLDQNETEKTYEQLQRQTSEPTYRNVDDNYTVLSL